MKRLPFQEMENLISMRMNRMLNWISSRFHSKENMSPVEILKFLKWHDCFFNATIAYRVLWTVPVIVARQNEPFLNWSCWNLTCVLQWYRNDKDLAMTTLESDMLEKIDYESTIEDLILRNTIKMKLFKRLYNEE